MSYEDLGADELKAERIVAYVEVMNRVLQNPQLVNTSLVALYQREHDEAAHQTESRKLYAAEVAQHARFAAQGVRASGMQTLKWLLLLNAGAAVVVAAYVGVLLARNGADDAAIPALTACVIPFGLGCLLVTLGGAFTCLSFSYAVESDPPAWALHQAIKLDQKKWPRPAGLKAGETEAAFYQRHAWQMKTAKRITMLCAAAAKLAFIAGLGAVVFVL
jgi:hypothetical protein